ncbi:MAG: hypothetical protein ABJO27_04550 [Pseudoruegeria sp.]
MKNLPKIASFWTGSDLSFVEQLVIQSYLDAGHDFTLYTIGKVGNLPSGITVKEAIPLCPPPFDISDNDRTRVAVYSDILRLYMIRDGGYVWVDMDAYCCRPYLFDTPYIFGENGRGRVLTGVLGLPSDSPSLTTLLQFLETDNPIIPWRGAKYRAERAQALKEGITWSIADLPWGVSGPKGLSHFLKRHNEKHHAQPQNVFYPLIKNDLMALWRPNVSPEQIEPQDCHSVHLFGITRKVLATRFNGLPPKNGYIEKLCERHNVDPKQAPISIQSWMQA